MFISPAPDYLKSTAVCGERFFTRGKHQREVKTRKAEGNFKSLKPSLQTPDMSKLEIIHWINQTNHEELIIEVIVNGLSNEFDLVLR